MIEVVNPGSVGLPFDGDQRAAYALLREDGSFAVRDFTHAVDVFILAQEIIVDGSGYPTGAMAEEIPVQSRMMTIADIFDALTASDRPYKKAVPTQKALDIIEMEVKSSRCDSELFRIFVESQVYKSVLGD